MALCDSLPRTNNGSDKLKVESEKGKESVTTGTYYR